jgi:hypothetical protein
MEDAGGRMRNEFTAVVERAGRRREREMPIEPTPMSGRLTRNRVLDGVWTVPDRCWLDNDRRLLL